MALNSFSTIKPKSVTLRWTKNTPFSNWHSLKDLNLGSVADKGVYVIRATISNLYYVYVGQGDIADRLSVHLRDASVTQHASAGNLWVAWAPVSELYRNGIERFLHNELEPRESSCRTIALPIEVNLP